MEMLVDFPTKWLLIEGLTPIFGAALIYTFWGVCRRLATSDGVSFNFAWKEAVDPFGWLYGAVIIAIQSATSLSSLSRHTTLFWMLILCAGACFFVLIAAMTERGTNPSWKPPKKLTGFALVLIGAILLVGAKTVQMTTNEQNTAKADEQETTKTEVTHEEW